jgi:hypothetical protein
MIEISYEKLSNQSFLQAVQKLASMPLPIRGAYNIKKLCDSIHKARKEIGQEYMDKVVELFAKKDADGKPLTEEGQIQFKDETPEEKEAFIKCQEEFGKTLKSLSRDKLVVGLHIPHTIEVSASDIAVLDSVLDFGPEPSEAPSPTIPPDSL